MNKAVLSSVKLLVKWPLPSLRAPCRGVCKAVRLTACCKSRYFTAPPRARRAPTIDGRRGVPEVSAACRVCADVCLSHVSPCSAVQWMDPVKYPITCIHICCVLPYSKVRDGALEIEKYKLRHSFLLQFLREKYKLTDYLRRGY